MTAVLRVARTRFASARCARVLLSRTLLLGLVLLLVSAGCTRAPILLRPEQRTIIDRSIVEYPAGFDLQLFAINLNAPTALAFDEVGSMIIAEGGLDGDEPRIFGFEPDGARFDIYPTGRRVPLLKTGFRIYGPIGGVAAWKGKIYVSHRDASGRGVITAFDYSGKPKTIVGDLPAQGDYGVTDLAVNPINERLYFGLGAATNSGVVGLDNFELGWVRKHPQFHDVPLVDYRLTPARFTTRNPRAGLFGGPEIAVTSAFQPFGHAALRAPKSPVERPSAAVYSVALEGGGLRVEAHGIRHPRGLAFNEFYNLYATNQGMELRGSRPVKDDPNTLVRIIPGTWYGWPDYSASLEPITDPVYQPDPAMIMKTGYPELSMLIDHDVSGLFRPNRESLLRAVFPSLSGAAKFDFATGDGAFAEYAGQAIVALSGDRAPFATSGEKLVGPIGHKVVRVNIDRKTVEDFIRNTRGLPASRLDRRAIGALERPIDVKFAPDQNALYIVDVGIVQIKDGKDRPVAGTGKILRLIPAGAAATTQPYDFQNPSPAGGKPHLQDRPR